MKFFEYHQNNSGGSFHINHKNGITVNVFIEAENVDEANAKAEAIGIYFDGVRDGRDCACCGDRWYEPYRDEGRDQPKVYGVPIHDGMTQAEHTDAVRKAWEEGNQRYPWFGPTYWHDPEVYIHYADGRIAAALIERS